MTNFTDNSESAFACNRGAETIECGAWTVSAVAETGRSHARDDRGCEDAFSIRRTDDGFVAVLCDGAGSARHAAAGSRVAAEAACTFLAERHDIDLDKDALLAAVLAAVDAEAEGLDAVRGDLASTLLAIKVVGRHGVVFHLGDGVVIESVCGRPRVLSGPARGEFANTTVFVTSTGAVAHMRMKPFRLTHGLSSLVMSTDGLQPLWLNRQNGVVAQSVEQLAALLDDHDVQVGGDRLAEAVRSYFAPRVTDDSSVVVMRACRPRGAFGPPVCPKCASWALWGARQENVERFDCEHCGCVFDRSQGADGRQLVSIVREDRPRGEGVGRLALQAVGGLAARAEGVSVPRSLSWWALASAYNGAAGGKSGDTGKAPVAAILERQGPLPTASVESIVLAQFRLQWAGRLQRFGAVIGLDGNGGRYILDLFPDEGAHLWVDALTRCRVNLGGRDVQIVSLLEDVPLEVMADELDFRGPEQVGEETLISATRAATAVHRGIRALLAPYKGLSGGYIGLLAKAAGVAWAG